MCSPIFKEVLFHKVLLIQGWEGDIDKALDWELLLYVFFERPKAYLLISLKRVHWVWAYQGILLGLKKQKLSSSKQLCKFASCVGRGCNWGWRSVFGKVGKSLRATHEFSFALNTAFILGHHNSFLVSYHGKFPSGFAFLVIVAEVHIDVVISFSISGITFWFQFKCLSSSCSSSSSWVWKPQCLRRVLSSN